MREKMGERRSPAAGFRNWVVKLGDPLKLMFVGWKVNWFLLKLILNMGWKSIVLELLSQFWSILCPIGCFETRQVPSKGKQSITELFPYFSHSHPSTVHLRINLIVEYTHSKGIYNHLPNIILISGLQPLVGRLGLSCRGSTVVRMPEMVPPAMVQDLRHGCMAQLGLPPDLVCPRKQR